MVASFLLPFCICCRLFILHGYFLADGAIDFHRAFRVVSVDFVMIPICLILLSHLLLGMVNLIVACIVCIPL